MARLICLTLRKLICTVLNYRQWLISLNNICITFVKFVISHDRRGTVTRSLRICRMQVLQVIYVFVCLSLSYFTYGMLRQYYVIYDIPLKAYPRSFLLSFLAICKTVLVNAWRQTHRKPLAWYHWLASSLSSCLCWINKWYYVLHTLVNTCILHKYLCSIFLLLGDAEHLQYIV